MITSNTISIKKIEKVSLQWPILAAMLCTIYFLFDHQFITAIGLGWTFFLFFVFVSRLGKSLPVLELMLFMAALQWIVGASISYSYNYQHFKYFMYVEEEVYMMLVVPGVIALSLGIFMFFPKYSFEDINFRLQKLVYEHKNIAFKLIALGLVSTYIEPYSPSALRFVFYLTSSFQYVGLALLLFSPHSKSKWNWFLLIMGILTLSSIMKGRFHDLLLWSALLFSFVIIQINLKFIGKIVIIFGGFVIAFVLQTVKAEFRALSYSLNNEDKLALFADLVQSQISGENEQESIAVVEMVSMRLNQGWIVSAIIDNTPINEPFANGETIWTAFSASLLPRFLVPNKKMAGGRDNFRRFTGLQIRNNTSMGTSIIGEAYANYGIVGSWVFMFIWGVFLAWGFTRLIRYGEKHPILFVFIPLIFLQVIKAETELAVVLNHFVKASFLVFSFLWFARKWLNWQV